MSWDNIPNGAAADFAALDRAEAKALADEQYADDVAAWAYRDARETLSGFEAALEDQCELPSCYHTVRDCKSHPDLIPKRELALRVIAEWHATWLLGCTAMAVHLESIVRAYADLERARALEKGAPLPEMDYSDMAGDY